MLSHFKERLINSVGTCKKHLYDSRVLKKQSRPSVCNVTSADVSLTTQQREGCFVLSERYSVPSLVTSRTWRRHCAITSLLYISIGYYIMQKWGGWVQIACKIAYVLNGSFLGLMTILAHLHVCLDQNKHDDVTCFGKQWALLLVVRPAGYEILKSGTFPSLSVDTKFE